MLLETVKKNTSIESIVARSLSLSERLATGKIPEVTDKNQAKIESRLKEWCDVVAQGDEAKFQRRLAWAGLDLDRVRALLIDTEEDWEIPLPQWASTLERVISKAKSLSSQEIFTPQCYSDPENPIPFEHFYLPCILVAREMLSSKVNSPLELLSKSTIAQLEQQLLRQLSEICTTTLMAEFSDFRSSGSTVKEFFLSQIIKCKSKEKYQLFIHDLFTDGLFSLFEKYSVLGKLLAINIELWSDATAEFINRLAEDWSEIEQRFSLNTTLKQVIDIKTGLSDPHNGKRSVIILTFDTGLKLVYKPRSLEIESAFFKFLDWCNCAKKLLPFQLMEVLDCGSYGWVEFIETLPCQNETEAQRYYERTGMLLCLIFLLEGTDCHKDNLISSAEQLILIDAETLLQHQCQTDSFKKDTSATNLLLKKLQQSPLKTLMLPQWGISSNDDYQIDLSFLGKKEDGVITDPQWIDTNTDSMRVEYNTETLEPTQKLNSPDISFDAQDYLTELVAGFKQMYQFLLARKDILLAQNSPLAIFANLKVRYVFRATNTYFSILQNSFAHNLLQSGIDRSISLDVLSRAFIQSEQKPDFWDTLEAELQAMEYLDIPFFTANTSQAHLNLSKDKVIPNLFEESSFSKVTAKFKSLSTTDLKEQVEVIRGSFCARYIQEPQIIIAESNTLALDEVKPLNSAQLVQESMNLAHNLKQKAIFGADGSMAWSGFELRKTYPFFQLQNLGSNTYNGCSGVALFLAPLAKVTGSSEWRNLALGALHSLRHDLNELNSQTIKQLTRLEIGGATGLGSIVYALVQTGYFLENSELVKDAQKLANLITPELIEADRNFNLMQGSAGAILVFLKLYKATSVGLEKAIACGEHLLKNKSEIAKSVTTGFGRGAAGIAYALLKLFAVTQDERFLEAAKAAIAYEQGSAASSYNNWTHGTAGIGLARLGGLSILDNETIRDDITKALEITKKSCLEDVDNLAWGNLGRIETLLVASQKLNRPDLFDFAQKATTQIVKQAQERGRFNLVSPSVPFAYNPGFFQGTTGIGYQLLRLAYPDLLPSILLWD